MGGGFIEKKLVVDEKQTTILLVHTKKIMSKTSSSSLSISYIGVGQILMGCSKKKKCFIFRRIWVSAVGTGKWCLRPNCFCASLLNW